MTYLRYLIIALLVVPITNIALAHQRGVTELAEGNVRQIYVAKPLTGAKGYVVSDLDNGQVRVEVFGFPASTMGFEAFLFHIDLPKYMNMMFVGGVKDNGVVSPPPAFAKVGGLISKWKSIGDFTVDASGRGTLNHRGGDNLYAQNFNMLMVFEKVTAGTHKGPEDFSKLMIECNGALSGSKDAMGREAAITVYKK